MPVKVFRNILKNHDFCPMFFELNGQDYEYYNSNSKGIPRAVDIELSSPSPTPDITVPKSKITIDLEIWDNYENQYWAMVNYISTDFRIANVIDRDLQDPRILFCDFLFNRTKAYHLNYQFKNNIKKWHWTHQDGYCIPTHPGAEHKNKIYLAPNKSWNAPHRKTHYRQKIVDLLLDKFDSLGYIGDYHRDIKLFLYPHWEMPDCTDINLLINQRNNTIQTIGKIRDTNMVVTCPPHNLYYENTFISIYGETIEYGTSIVVTEKTYDPLIKGHFILPFSCMGYVDRLRNLGFRMPDFINYEYDNEPDDQKRFALYLEETKRLLCMTINAWRLHWNNNLDLIRHNQSIFFDREYDRIDFDLIL